MSSTNTTQLESIEPERKVTNVDQARDLALDNLPSLDYFEEGIDSSNLDWVIIAASDMPNLLCYLVSFIFNGSITRKDINTTIKIENERRLLCLL